MSKKQQAIRVIPGKSRKHKIETRVFPREIHETFCAQKECKFYNKEARQGICHTTKTFVGSLDWSYIDSLFEQGREYLEENRKIYRGKPKEWLRFLENVASAHWMSEVCSLDQLIRLRRENALLQHRLEVQTKRVLRRSSRQDRVR